MIEQLRLGLIKWNAAPLVLVGFLSFLTYLMVEAMLHMPTCENGINEIYIALSGTVLGMAGLLFKMYESLQKNRGETE
jgi:hypothetical protein